jgi:hypothetical protein
MFAELLGIGKHISLKYARRVCGVVVCVCVCVCVCAHMFVHVPDTGLNPAVVQWHLTVSLAWKELLSCASFICLYVSCPGSKWVQQAPPC